MLPAYKSSSAQEENMIHVVTGGLVSGSTIGSYAPDLKAVWNASYFVMYDNGILEFDMTLRHLSANPETSSIYNSILGLDEQVPSNGTLRYLTSIILVRVFANYVYNFTFTDGGERVYLTQVIPIEAISIDNQTSFISFRGNYDKSKDHPTALTNVVLDGYEVQLSWLRVFVDEEGDRYYQLLMGRENCGENKNIPCESQIAELNHEYESMSGSFRNHMPIPEEMVNLEYVTWAHQNIKDIPEFSSSFIAVTIGVAVVTSFVLISGWYRIGRTQ